MDSKKECREYRPLHTMYDVRILAKATYRFICRLLLCAPLIIFCLFSATSLVQASRIASYEYIYIVYAQGDDVEHKKYVETIERIKLLEPNVRVRFVNRNAPPSNLQSELFKEAAQCVIGLGRPALAALNGMSHKHKFDIVYGLVDDKPTSRSDYFAISTSPSPRILFEQLGVLDAKRKKIFVVYLKGRDDELIKVAQKEAESKGLTLVALESEGLSDMAVKFQNAIKEIDAKRDALWLLSSAEVDSAIVNGILSQAWERKMFVFSSNYLDVNRGVIFSLRPDYSSLGDKLVERLSSIRFKPKQQPFVAFTHDASVVVNTLTAKHLGVAFSEHQLDRYTFINPAANNAK